MTTVMVTGATGNVGEHVVRNLLDSGHDVIATSHNPDNARERFGGEVDCRKLDFLDPDTWSAAEGADHLFLMRPPAISDVAGSINPFVDHARQTHRGTS